MPEISVIVPVFNAALYLNESIESILCQTFGDYELLLIDDGSMDSSGDICDSFAKKDPRIRVFHQRNMGQSAARNRGVKESSADLVCFIDADDEANPVLLEKLYTGIKQSDAGIAVSARISGKSPSQDFCNSVDAATELIVIDEEKLLHLFRSGSTLYWTLFPCLMKKSIYLKYPLAEGRVMEDNAVSCKWLTEAKKIVYIKTPLYFYRENPAGTMNSPFSEKKLDYLWALEEQLSFYDSVHYSEIAGAVAKHYVECARWLAARVKNELNDERLAKSVIKKAVHIRNRYADVAGFTEEENRKLFKAAHPFLHRVKKRLQIQK